MKKLFVLFSVVLSILAYSCKTGEDPADKGPTVMAYYYTRWENFKPETLPYDKLTHIIFSFTEVIDIK